MTPADGQTFRTLTRLLALCEQADHQIANLHPPVNGTLALDLAALRLSLYETLRSPRFSRAS